MHRLLRTVTATLVGLLLAVTATPAQAAPAPTPRITPGEYRGQLASGATWLGHVPEAWNGELIVFSHGYGSRTAQDAPNEQVRQVLLSEGYALVGSSYSGPSLWALESAPGDQAAAIRAFTTTLRAEPDRTIALGTSMGGLVSALLAQNPRAGIDGVLTTCGLVAGGINLNNYQLDGLYALTRLLAPERTLPLVRYRSPEQAADVAAQIVAIVTAAQATPQGRARIALGSALLNMPTWYSESATAPSPRDYAGQEQEQFRGLTAGGIERYVTGRQQIELAAGGNTAWNVGVNYRTLLDSSVHAEQVRALYRSAALDLRADLDTLTRDADVTADPAAVRKLTRTSMVTGNVRVPHLTMHTVADDLVPVEQENWYRKQVASAGDAPRVRQAYVHAAGHCRFRPREHLAALHALEQRIERGTWGTATEPARLNDDGRTADEAGGAPRFVEFTPPRLVGGLREPGRAARRR